MERPARAGGEQAVTNEITLAGERLLHRLSTALAREAWPDAVVRVALDALVSEVGARSAGVFLYDETTTRVTPVYTVNYLPQMLDDIQSLTIDSPALSNLALRTGDVQVIASTNDVPEGVVFTSEISERIGVRAVVALPLIQAGRTLGVLVYGLAEEHEFELAELQLLEEVGERIATAMERARLEQELARRADEAELLHAIALAASGEDDINLILEATLSQLAGLLRFTGGSISLTDGDALVVHAASGLFTGTGADEPARQVLATGTPFLNNDLPSEGPVRSALIVPLNWRDQPLGVLEIHATEPGAFTPDDVHLMQRVATLLSGPIELARRFAAEVQLRRDLDQARGRLEAIIQHAPMCISFFDANEQLVFINQFAIETLRLPADLGSAGGRSWAEMLDSVLRERWAGKPEALRTIVEETRTLREGILIHDYPLHSPEQMLLRIAAPVSELGRFSGHVILLIDVTSERQAITQRDRFISIASHELKTPLTSIKGMAQLLLRAQAAGRLDPERAIRQITTIDTQADRLQDLIDDLLDISRIQSGRLDLRPEPADLVSIVHGLISTLPDDRRERVQLHATEPAIGTWDPLRLEQVAQNLLDNALKYSGSDTTVDVTIQTDAETATLTVTDYGIGIPVSELPHLFEPFIRATNAGKHDETGLGLGLFITRQIIEHHAGTITVATSEGEGSTFTVRLPR